MAERRKDSKKRVLKEGEYQRSNGTYEYRWRSENGKRNNVYAKSLEELREKEAEIQRDRSDGIRAEARNATINDIHEQWLQLKKGLKANTLVNYEYMYKMYVFPEFGKRKVGSKNLVLLPRSSCHSLRHTCATRLCEAGINMKVIQDVLGHADITTTMNIYTEATKNLKKKEIDKFAEFLSASSTCDGKEEND